MVAVTSYKEDFTPTFGHLFQQYLGLRNTAEMSYVAYNEDSVKPFSPQSSLGSRLKATMQI
jgi:hypothetical protein